MASAIRTPRAGRPPARVPLGKGARQRIRGDVGGQRGRGVERGAGPSCVESVDLRGAVTQRRPEREVGQRGGRHSTERAPAASISRIGESAGARPAASRPRSPSSFGSRAFPGRSAAPAWGSAGPPEVLGRDGDGERGVAPVVPSGCVQACPSRTTRNSSTATRVPSRRRRPVADSNRCPAISTGSNARTASACTSPSLPRNAASTRARVIVQRVEA